MLPTVAFRRLWSHLARALRPGIVASRPPIPDVLALRQRLQSCSQSSAIVSSSNSGSNVDVSLPCNAESSFFVIIIDLLFLVCSYSSSYYLVFHLICIDSENVLEDNRSETQLQLPVARVGGLKAPTNVRYDRDYPGELIGRVVSLLSGWPRHPRHHPMEAPIGLPFV